MATQEEFNTWGLSPDEAALYEQHEQRVQAHLKEVELQDAAALTTAMQTAVSDGDMTNVEAAEQLRQSGYELAWKMFTAAWQAEEAAEIAAESAAWFAGADAETYLSHINTLDELERDEIEQELRQAYDDRAKAQLGQINERLNEWVASTPGAQAIAPAVTERIKHTIVEKNSIPETTEEQDRMIAQAAREVGIAEDLRESLTQQVDAEWRIHRRENGAKDNLMTEADIAKAEAAFKETRFKQLAEATMVPKSILELPPSSEDVAASALQKYSGREQKSTSFHERVAGIAARGTKPGSGDRGEVITDEKRAYREAMARAEQRAAFGEVATGYGDARLDAPKTGPLDEYGDAFGFR
jgi:hypothetical protein